MRVVITGGAGFIGHHLVNAFSGTDDDVCALSDLIGQLSNPQP